MLKLQFHKTFDAINSGENTFVKKRPNGTLRFITPKKEPSKPTIDLYPKEYAVPIFEVLHTVNQHTHFTQKLTHHLEEYRRETMSDAVNFATTIGWDGRPLPV